MAIKRGYRFPIPFREAFPQGLLLLGEISQKTEYNADPRATPKPVFDIDRDGQGTGLPIWVASVTDPHEGNEGKAKRASFEIEFVAQVQPVPVTPEVVPGTGLRMIELEGLTAEPAVVRQSVGEKNFSYVSYKFRATGIKGDNSGAKQPPADIPGRKAA
ncbi:hypothetical protein [Nocardia arthritidis]|uniref:Plasmid replication, integration and excision activator n=1 Tax=Nocardia arthritidis TaxID=228602 RepID=A0A6G9Y849_9NOCA|nr:hypothetical protein [Nocardia arthritidis]QIS09381.1 hypothetical protein F5544_07375 [Nocardia arthritidis]